MGLDPGSRALLDLSLRRRIPDDEIADFLGIDAAAVARRRAAALRRLGTDLEIERPEELTGMLTALAALQLQLLEKAVSFMKPGGIMVFCTCSLEPEEGEHHLRTLPPDTRHLPLKAQNDSLKSEWLSPDLCLRTLPNQKLDGFFAMLLERL